LAATPAAKANRLQARIVKANSFFIISSSRIDVFLLFDCDERLFQPAAGWQVQSVKCSSRDGGEFPEAGAAVKRIFRPGGGERAGAPGDRQIRHNNIDSWH
jgi:hypothetical protein